MSSSTSLPNASAALVRGAGIAPGLISNDLVVEVKIPLSDLLPLLSGTEASALSGPGGSQRLLFAVALTDADGVPLGNDGYPEARYSVVAPSGGQQVALGHAIRPRPY
jgi:hypothetical protein